MPSDTTTRIGSKVEDAAKGSAPAGLPPSTSQDRGAGSSGESKSPGAGSARTDTSMFVKGTASTNVKGLNPSTAKAGGGKSPGSKP